MAQEQPPPAQWSAGPQPVVAQAGQQHGGVSTPVVPDPRTADPTTRTSAFPLTSGAPPAWGAPGGYTGTLPAGPAAASTGTPQLGAGYPYGPYTSPQPGGYGSRPAGSRAVKVLLMTLAAVLIAIGGGVVGGLLVGLGSGDGKSGKLADGDVANTEATLSLAEMAAKLQPSVVMIEVEVGSQRGTGSGVVVSPDGLVLTNNHVVGDADEIEVNFVDGDRETAEVIEADPELDLAVVKIDDVKDLPVAKIGNSGTLRVGDTVVAIGSPLGLEGSVTAGIISGLDRTIPARGERGGGDIEGVIQTDAAINPGNSGGPLLNTKGEVVGINTAIATTSQEGGNIGLGFAVPVDAAKELLEKARN
ncbi:MAG: trypsin-like peptidase domain-containing protein [Micromonosporaceae bacterium]